MADTTNDDALNGTSEAFIDELSTQLWALVNVASTGKWINPRFSQLLPSLTVITGLLASLEFSFCPGLEEIFGSFVPPASSWFKSLPGPSDIRGKMWGVYCLVFEKEGHPDHVYVGSGTATQQGIRARINTHRHHMTTGDPDAKGIVEGVKKMIKDGFTLTSTPILAYCPIPTPKDEIRGRSLCLALESYFHCIFWSLRSRDPHYGYFDDLFGDSMCLWPKESFTYMGLNSHNPLLEGIYNDKDMTDEQKEEIAAVKKENRRAYNREYRKVYRLTEQYRASLPAYYARDRKVVKANRKKAMELKLYHCDVCDKSFPDSTVLRDHLKTPRHIRKAKEDGRGPWCFICHKGYKYPCDLKAHYKRDCHRDQEAALAARLVF